MVTKRLLITGCSGFIGRNIAALAIKKGYTVIGVDTVPCPVNISEFRKLDITNKKEVDDVVSEVDVVIHLAAITSVVEFEKNMKRCYEINVGGFLNVIDAAVKSGCNRFIYASSAAVYENNFSEEVIIDIGKQKNHYAKTKLMNEMIAQSYKDVHGIDVTGLRYFNVYGVGENQKGDYASVITKFMEANKQGKPLLVYGDGKQSRDMINVLDAAEITLEIMEKGKDTLYNVGTGNPISYGEIADIINKKNKHYVNNPLSSYQYLTRADMGRLRTVIGNFEFVKTEDWIKKAMK